LSPNRNGIISAYLLRGGIAQIEVAAPRYHTVDGITEGSSPEEVRRHYPGLKAYAVLNSAVDFVGGRDLIFWVDRESGIAFEFQYDRKARKRFVKSVSVFMPGTDFLPHGRCVELPQEWHELERFSLEPPNYHNKKPQ
jgi:hypothetical protein